MRILVFGDSIAYGAWDTKGGWVERLKQYAHKRTVESDNIWKLQVINLGIGGNSSADILARLEAEISARYSKSWPLVLIFSYCTNDERSRDGIVQTSMTAFRQNNEQIIEIAKRYSDKILFVGAPPLPQAEINFKGQTYSDTRIREYEMILKEQVEGNGLPFLPVRDVFERVSPDEIFNVSDDPHPNDRGHELIYDTVRPVIEELLER